MRPAGRLLGRRSCLGRERNPLPSSGFILVPSDSTQSTTPLLVFISVCCGVASAANPLDFDEGRRSSLAMDAHSGNSPEAECKCLPQVRSKTIGLLPPMRACPPAAAPFRFSDTQLLFQFCRLVLSFLPSRARRDSVLPLRLTHAKVFPLRRW